MDLKGSSTVRYGLIESQNGATAFRNFSKMLWSHLAQYLDQVTAISDQT